MGKKVSVSNVKRGDVVLTERGKRYVVQYARWNRRGATVLEGAYESDLAVMLKSPKDTTKMSFLKWTIRRDNGIEVVGKVSESTVKKMDEMHMLLSRELEKRRGEKMDALNLKWNPDVLVKRPTTRGGTKYWRGANDVMTKKGEHVKAGDLVMVKFSNGDFKMVMGNENGHTYDGKTGNFLCRSPWKVGRSPKYKMKYDPLYGVVQKKVVMKARSMPPDSLLYLIQKKEDYEKSRGAY